MLKGIIYSFSILSICSSFLAIVYYAKWWSRIFEVVQPYLVIATLISISLLLWHVNWNVLKIILILLLMLSLLRHSQVLLPFTLLAKKEIKWNKKVEADLTLFTINIYSENKNRQALLKAIEQYQPDLILLIEYNAFWKSSLETLLSSYSYRVEIPKEDGFGLGLFSKLPLIQSDIKYLIDTEIPSIHTQIKLPLRNQTINFAGVHPSPPLPWARGNTIEKDLEIFKIADMVQKSPLPFIVTGDFNDVGWALSVHTFKNSSGLLDPRIGRGFYNTFHAKNPFVNYPIDHTFLSADFELTKFKRIKVKGSDHFGLLTGISLKSK